MVEAIVILMMLVLSCGVLAGICFKGKMVFVGFMPIIIGLVLSMGLFIESQRTGFGRIAQETVRDIDNNYRSLGWGTIYETIKSVEVEGKTITFIRNRETGNISVYRFAKEPPKFFIKREDEKNPYLAVLP